ncbi:alpha/beta hydrolase family esterase [Prosthecobacter sp.]|jgi:polyhydroxybutyrate depolymerase|uniref:alpha/beta hydrolase family esterase n=1 Tax=Prosthecobacter sp. TaxID=1965333 RepID=UPI003784C061
MKHRFISLFAGLVSVLIAPLACHAQGQLPEGVTKLEITLDGVTRTGFLYAPPSAKESPAPVVFVWHGHGGTAMAAGRSFAMHKHWPEAISVYLQGLNTPGKLTDPEGKKPGWQHGEGAEGDRDLKLFDAVLAHLKKNFKVDAKRIFSTGHSNGGGFTYLLWETRPEVFCAVAPSASASARLADRVFKPKPCMHIAGTEDPLVKYAWQEMSMAKVKQINQCEAEGKKWAKDCTLFASKVEAPFVAFIHQGTHKFPDEAPALIAKFFKEQAKAVK